MSARSGLVALAALVIATTARAAAAAGDQPQPVDQIEQRLQKIEKVVDDLVSGRAELRTGMRELLAKKKVTEQDARALCESVGDQSKVITLVGGQIALLEREENRNAMSAKQRARLARARTTLDRTPPQMDCSSF
jgi:hypothetical protein